MLWSLLLLPLSLADSLNITVLQPSVPIIPSLPPPPASKSDEIVSLFQNLGRTTVWDLISAIPMQGETWEPEGMVKIGDRIVVSAGECIQNTVAFGKNPDGSSVIINGTDRANGQGFAHLIVFDLNGTRIADATLTKQGAAEYHNGGIDYDGTYIWATIAQYRPNSTASIVRVDPTTLEPTTIAHVEDHQGGIVHDTVTDKLYTLNWGSRNASTFCVDQDFAPYPDFTQPVHITRNPSYFVDYQDCKFLGHPSAFDCRCTMLCSGVATIGSGNSSYNLGGVALVDCESMIPFAEVPIALSSQLGVRITQNPVEVDVVDGKLRFYWMPDQHNSTLYVYEARPDSPFEYGGSGGSPGW